MILKTLVMYLICITGLLVLMCSLDEEAEATLGGVKCGGTGMAVCLTTASPFVNQYLKPGSEWTYCVNARGRIYPGFVDQTAKVMQRWAEDLRTTTREVPYPTNATSTACTVRNDMRDDHPCSECGAWIYTQAMPVLIEYNAKAGFIRFDSTLGHEFGHGACLLDEHYDEANFRSWILTYGAWQHGAPTVMDIGSWLLREFSPLGIWYPTEYDLGRCAETLGRAVGPKPPVECLRLGLDPCTGRWYQPDGWSWDPLTAFWHTPLGGAEWTACNADGIRFNLALSLWAQPGSGLFTIPSRGFWTFAPQC